MIIQGSNVPISIKFDSSLLNVQDIKVAIYQKPGQILKDFNFEDISIEGDRIVIPVTQEVTAGLPDGLIFLEIKWLSGDGYIHFAKPVRDEVLKRNDKRVLSGEVTGTEEELETVEIEQFTIIGEGSGVTGIDKSEISKMISDFFNAHKDELKGADGKDGKDGLDGSDGVNGVNGRDGINGKDGIDGKDGYTPQKGVDYFDGADGKNGLDGYTPVKGVDYFTPQEIAEFINTVKNGVSDGKTPIKGTDYFTNADKQELINDVINSLPMAESEEF